MPQDEIPWRKNPLREVLRQDIEKGNIPEGMVLATAQKLRNEYGAMDKMLFRSRLAGMRKSVKGAKPKEKQKWNQKNPLRQQLHDDIAVGLIPPTTAAKQAWVYRDEYHETMEFPTFKSRFLSMVKIVTKKLERAKSDAEDLEHDLAIHARPTRTAKGEPVWNYHEAPDLLEIDIDDGWHKRLKTPEPLWLKQHQYQDFSLETFRGHYHQEIQTRKWRNQWVDGKKEYALVAAPSD